MKLFGGRRGRASPPPRSKAPPDPPEEKLPLGERMRAAIKRVPRALFGLVALALLAGAAVYFLWARPPETQDAGLASPTVRPAMPERTTPPPETPPPPETTEEPEPEPSAAKAEMRRREACYTFLILALDPMGANTDAILAGRLDAERGTLDVVSLPRDTLVNVSWAVKKLNTVYIAEERDMERVLDHVKGLLGFSLDSYAVVDAVAVEKLVNAMGGVTYYVPRSMDYDDVTQDLHIHLSEGYQYLTGSQVVDVLRFREGNNGTGYVDGDLGRIRMQQDLLHSVAEQLLQKGTIPNLETLIEVFRENVTTDLSPNNLAWFAGEFLRMKKENVRFYTAPGNSVSIRGGSYYALELEPWLETLNEALNPYDQDVTPANLDLLRVPAAGDVVSTTGETIPIYDFLNFYALN